MKSAVAIVCISIVGLIVGATTLCGFLSGALGVVLGPLFAIFGWFYLVPILAFVCILWFSYNPTWNALTKRAFVTVASLIACLMMFAIGLRGPDSGVEWVWGYCVGGLLSGCVCALLVAWWRSETK